MRSDDTIQNRTVGTKQINSFIIFTELPTDKKKVEETKRV